MPTVKKTKAHADARGVQTEPPAVIGVPTRPTLARGVMVAGGPVIGGAEHRGRRQTCALVKIAQPQNKRLPRRLPPAVQSATRMHPRELLLLLLLSCTFGWTQQSSPTSPVQEAKSLIDAGKLDDAIQKLAQLQAQQPEPKDVEHELGLAYYRKGDFAAAQAAFAKAMEQDPQDRESVQLRGLSLYQMGRPAEAIPYLKQVQSWIGSANVDANYVLGLCYLHTQNYDEARKSFAQMYGVPPESAGAYLFVARMLLRQGYDPVAEQNAQKAAALDPKLPLVHYLLGEFYLYKSNVEKAIQELELEQQLNPGYAGTYDRLGDAYSRIGKYDEAERALQRSILLDATATGPYILMGKVLLKKKDYASAATYLQKAARMDPSNYITHHLMGEAYRGLGRTADADRELKQSEELQTAQEQKPQG